MMFPFKPGRELLAIAALLFLLAPRGTAIMTPTSDPGHTSEKALQKALKRILPESNRFPFWKNIGFLNESSAVYVGNGFVLTAAHVGPGVFYLNDGSSYEPIRETSQRFRNPDGTFADLYVFQVRYRPSDSIARLRSIPFGPVRPSRGSNVVLIGAGSGNSGPSIKESDFRWNEDYRLRWGLNRVEVGFSGPMATYQFKTPGYATRFGESPMDCQATPGDSGGAAFVFNYQSQRWELGGIILAIDGKRGQARTGNQTYIADLTILPSNIFSGKLFAGR